MQATLPVKSGGLGIHSAIHLASSVFLSSASASNDLVHHILPPRFVCKEILHVDAALTSWSHGHDHPPPEGLFARRQKVWDACKVSAMADTLLENVQDAQYRARLLAASTKESGAWLNTLPISSLGLRKSRWDYIRLGSSLCLPHDCYHCGVEVNCLGTHGLSCKWSEGRHRRHAALNDIVHRALTMAHILSHLEPAGICRSDGKCPDGVSVVPWKNGKSLVWDATCPDTFAPSYLASAASEAGNVAAAAESRKKNKYSNLDRSYSFVPVAIETTGVFGPDTTSFLKELGQRLRQVTGDDNSHRYLIQHLSVAVQQGNSASVMGVPEAWTRRSFVSFSFLFMHRVIEQ